jgi:hypothetical protein
MRTRTLKNSDIPALRAMAEASGFPYPDLSAERLEAVVVVVDDEDRPVMACAAERLVQLYLWCGEFQRPHAKLYALRLLHEAMAEDLRRKGYVSAEAFLPPSLAKRFARRLEKTLGWKPNWPSWTHLL